MFSRRPSLARCISVLQSSQPQVCTFRSTPLFLNAASVASTFLSRFQSRGPETRRQVLDANQLQLLSLTLNRPTLYRETSHLCNNAPAPPMGTPIPPGYHLIYFTPAFLEHELGVDGTDASYNPDPPFTRRMWAGGEVRWPRDESGRLNLLRVGQEVKETTRVLTAEPKVVRKTGEEMVVVGVEKAFENEDGIAVIDRRNWVFRERLPFPPLPTQSTSTPPPPASESKQSSRDQSSSPSNLSGRKVHKRSFNRSAVTLFRFSALTFNSHKIHYSLPWARDVEGHRSIVVHGPLNLISILDFWRDIRQQEGKRDSTLIVPQSIAYRATSPLYAEEEYEIVLEDLVGQSAVDIYNAEGVVSMRADIKDS